MTKVKLEDIRALQVPGRRGYCINGTRKWFIKHGLDWELFVREGLDACIIDHVTDPMARKVVAQAERREREEQERAAWADHPQQ